MSAREFVAFAVTVKGVAITAAALIAVAVAAGLTDSAMRAREQD